jgi:cell division ATPase FtsA
MEINIVKNKKVEEVKSGQKEVIDPLQQYIDNYLDAHTIGGLYNAFNKTKNQNAKSRSKDKNSVKKNNEKKEKELKKKALKYINPYPRKKKDKDIDSPELKKQKKSAGSQSVPKK